MHLEPFLILPGKMNIGYTWIVLALAMVEGSKHRQVMTIPKMPALTCTPVSVLGDAVYCIPHERMEKDTVCSGSGKNAMPHGSLCPKMGDESFDGCRQHLPSYDPSTSKCVAKSDGKCQIIDSGVWGCVFEEKTNAPTPAPTMDDEKKYKELKIVAYNDVYVMEPVSVQGHKEGGASRVAKYITELKQEEPETLVMFPGDTMSPSLWSKLFHGLQMVTAHNHMKLDFASLGNHEFDMGLDAFYNVSQHSNFPWLNANCFEIENDQLLKGTVPNAIKVVNNMTLGVFGVMYDMQDNSTGVYWTDPIEAANEQVAILQEMGAEFIVALTHQKWEDDNSFSNKVKGVDLMLGGHDHSAMMQTDFGTPYVKADLDFKSVWVVDVEHYAGKKPYSAINYLRKTISENMPTDPALDVIIEEYKAIVDIEFGKPIGSTQVELDGTQKVVRTRECPLGNFISDSHRYAYSEEGSDIGIMNGGGIRDDRVHPVGEITIADVVSWSPFGNFVAQIELSGAALRALINEEMKESCTSHGALRQNGMLVHPSGFTYEFHCTGDEMGQVKEVRWEKDTKEIIADDEDLILNFSNYMYTVNADLLAKFDVKVLKGEAEGMVEDGAIIQYVEKLKTIAPKLEGRFTIFP